MKKVFLENLPRMGKRIDWKSSVGYNISFIYHNIEGVFTILRYIEGSRELVIKYKNGEYTTTSDRIQACKFYYMLDEYDKFKYYENKTEDLRGKRFGSLVVERLDFDSYKLKLNNKNIHSVKWICKCDCGKYTSVPTHRLIDGSTKTCGLCLSIDDYMSTRYGVDWKLDMWSNNNDCDPNEINCKGDKYVLFICPNCHEERRIQAKTVYQYGKITCECYEKSSYPNKLMYHILKQNKINFISEYSPDWASSRRYDFYLPDYNIIIEMDGAWHYKDNVLSGQSKDETVLIDKEKDNLSLKNRIEVIRVNCLYSDLNYIVQSISKTCLLDTLNIKDTDWKACDLAATSSMTKKAWDLWNEGIHSTKEIGNIIGVSSKTVRLWLKKGNELNKCECTSKELQKIRSENAKVAIVAAKSKKVRVVGYDMDFNSIAELSRLSEGIFGVKFSSSKIVNVCKGKSIQHKGYRFEYIL